MSRHTQEALQRQIEGYRAMSPERKLEIASGLRAFAWETKLASLRLHYPALPEDAIRSRLREFFGQRA